jgi:hypothetical protein
MSFDELYGKAFGKTGLEPRRFSSVGSPCFEGQPDECPRARQVRWGERREKWQTVFTR